MALLCHTVRNRLARQQIMHCLSVREDLKKNFSKEISIPVSGETDRDRLVITESICSFTKVNVPILKLNLVVFPDRSS